MLLPLAEEKLKGTDYVHFDLRKGHLPDDDYDTLQRLVQLVVPDGYRGSMSGIVDIVARRIDGGSHTPAKTQFSALHNGMIMQCNPTCNVTLYVCRSWWCNRLQHHPRHGLGAYTNFAPPRWKPNVFGRDATAFVVCVPFHAHPLN